MTFFDLLVALNGMDRNDIMHHFMANQILTEKKIKRAALELTDVDGYYSFSSHRITREALSYFSYIYKNLECIYFLNTTLILYTNLKMGNYFLLGEELWIEKQLHSVHALLKFTCHLLPSHNTFLERQTKGCERKVGDMEGKRKEINWDSAGEKGRGRSWRPCDGRWHRSSACGQGKQLKMKQTHRQVSVCRCPLAAPLAFIPHPLPHCPASPACYPPIRAQGGGGTVGTHQSVLSVRGSGLMLAQHRGAQKKAGTAS